MHSTFRMEWRPAEVVPQAFGEVLMENKVVATYLRRADFEQWCLGEGCPGCWYLRTGQVRQQAHSDACPKRIEGLLKGDAMGAARLAAADERINRAAADAVEGHAVKDLGVRGTLKRATCRPESESQKKIALDTEQESTVLYGGSSTSGDQNASTSDATRANNEEHVGGDVTMEGDSAQWRSPKLSGARQQKRITTKREPCEVGDEQSNVTEQHVPRRSSGKTAPQERAVAVTTQEALDGSCEKTMRIANVENNALNWVSISSAGVLDMTHCDFGVRSARDEMRQFLEAVSRMSSLGLTRIRKRDVRSKTRTTWNSCAICTKRKQHAVATYQKRTRE